MLKRTISFCLAFVLAVSFTCSCDVRAANYWDSVAGTNMPMFPPDGYVSMQNPPDFTWPYVTNAKTYHLQVLTDGGDTPPWASVVFYYDGTNNYYNHSAPMEPGKTYYWRVRCDFINGTQTEWSKSKSFRIHPDAVEFTVPQIDTLISNVKTTHPRVLTTDVTEFRKIKDTNETSKAVYDYYVDAARGYLTTYADGLPAEPSFDDATGWWNKELNTYYPDKYEEYVLGSRQYKWKSSAMLSIVQNSSYAYLLTGDANIGDFAVNALVEMSGWDIEGPTSYTFDSQRHREIVYQCAMAYDWLYNIMTENQRATVRNMIKDRITKVYEVKEYVTDSSGNIVYDSATGKPKTSVVSTSSMSTLLESIKRVPLDSMGWTAIGYLGIAAYALSGDFKAADSSLSTDPATDWLKTILPLYTAVMPPWSGQDGGWSQGTYYWRVSSQTSKEFTDILALGGVINLYDKVWSQNEYLWALYAFPTGSYGSFGEGSNRATPESEIFTRNNLGRIAYFTDNPVAAWISDSQGGPSEDLIYNYYSAQGMSEIESPDDYPLSHVFSDVGLAVLTNSLTDTDRIQLSFKSSPYGTYNHSQQDQNAFILQAYGENLAIKSGFYDYYNSPHSNNVERATYARNTITVNNNGQSDKSLYAQGKIVQFANQIEFDSVTGSAHQAYSWLDRYDRSIIYVRPDVFIVIDDIDIAGTNVQPVEWWLNAEKKITYTDTSAIIEKGAANLRADVHYPETTALYYDKFINPKDGIEYPPTGEYASYEPHKRVAFKTPAVADTKMVVTMSVYEDSSEAKQCVSENKGTYLKLTFEDSNTVTLVNLGDVTQSVNAADEGITFTGAAVTYNESSILLTNGTYLQKGSRKIISSTNPLTAVIGLGQIFLSSNTDFEAKMAASTEYMVVENVSHLKDMQGRKISLDCGIGAYYDMTNAEVNFVAKKGHHSVLNGEKSFFSPGQLKIKDVSVQKSSAGKAGVYWTVKADEIYDVMVDGILTENVSSVPFVFDVNPSDSEADSVRVVRVRKRVGKIKGVWSDPVYVSSYVDESRDNVDFALKSGILSASTTGFDADGNFSMYLSKYDADGNLSQAVLAQKEGTDYKASLIADGSLYKVFLMGNALMPLASSAVYGSVSTELKGIYIDGKPIEGFDNSIGEYLVEVPHTKLLFPFVSAKAKDNSSKVTVNYDFNNYKAVVAVTAPNGLTREFTVLFSLDKSNVHIIADPSTGKVPAFGRDAGYGPVGVDEREADKSVTNTGKFTFTRKTSAGVTTNETQNVQIFTNFKSNEGGDLYGARVRADRPPYPAENSNHMEIIAVPDDLKGYDYFVPMHNGVFNKNDAYSNAKFSFSLASPGEIVVLSVNRLASLANDGYSEGSVSVQGRYMNWPEPEDWYYNVVLKGRDYKTECVNNTYPPENIGNFRLVNYSIMEEWIDVAPIASVVSGLTDTHNTQYKEACQKYIDSGKTEKDFSVVGNCLASAVSTPSNMLYKYSYTKSFDAGNVDVYMDEFKNSNDGFIIIVRPNKPMAFDAKN